MQKLLTTVLAAGVTSFEQEYILVNGQEPRATLINLKITNVKPLVKPGKLNTQFLHANNVRCKTIYGSGKSTAKILLSCSNVLKRWHVFTVDLPG